MSKQRVSRLSKLYFDNAPYTPSSGMTYNPDGKAAHLNIYPSYEYDFPDVTGIKIPIRSGMKAPAYLSSEGFAAWVEIEGRRRAIFAISVSGDSIECDTETPFNGEQLLTIQTDTTGKVEAVKGFVHDGADPSDFIKRAAILYQFEAQAKPITSGQTKVLPIDRERLVHNFTAELNAAGVSFTHTAPVSEIRAKKLDIDGFKYWKRAFLWPYGNGKSIIAETTLGGYHVATYDANGRQQYSGGFSILSAALNAAFAHLNEV